MSRKFSNALLAMTGTVTLAATVAWTQPVQASEPFLGQIEYYAFNFAPRSWARCDGQLLSISTNSALFSLLGTTFGGDGRTTFALPDMRGRIPVHAGNSTGPGLTRRNLGERGGTETVTLGAAQIPSHTHSLRGTTTTGNQMLPAGNTLAQDAPDQTYRNAAPDVDMRAGSISASPGGAHENMPPFLVLNCSIALAGIYPSRS